MRKVYQCEHTVPPVWWFTFADRNALGEEIVVEFRKNENTHGKHSLPAMWKRKGFIDKEPETWWGVQTYVTDRQGRCSGKYNPTTKDGKLNFEWLLEATEENRQKIIDEIYRRSNAIWHREDWYLEDLEEAIRHIRNLHPNNGPSAEENHNHTHCGCLLHPSHDNHPWQRNRL